MTPSLLRTAAILLAHPALVARAGRQPAISLLQLKGELSQKTSSRVSYFRELYAPEGQCASLLKKHKQGLNESGFFIPDNGQHYGIQANETEGGATNDEFAFLSMVASALKGNATLCQTGFNYGTSALAFLCATPPGIRVRSWDLGDHSYVARAGELIEERFPGRHELFLGDSTQSLKEAAARGDLKGCDMVFVDGGHSFDVCLADITNFRQLLSNPNAMVLVDDCALSTNGEELGAAGGLGQVNECFHRAVTDSTIKVSENSVEFDGFDRSVCIGEYI